MNKPVVHHGDDKIILDEEFSAGELESVDQGITLLPFIRLAQLFRLSISSFVGVLRDSSFLFNLSRTTLSERR